MITLNIKQRRSFYLGIIIICLLFLALSISGLFRFTTYAKREKNPTIKDVIDEDTKKEQKHSQVSETGNVSQEIYGLYLPSYDEDGKLVSVVRGAYTVFLNNKTYIITKPEIEFAGDSNKDGKTGQPKEVIITADTGEMDNATKSGIVYGNVISRLGTDLEIHTEDFTYSPEDNTVDTDGPATVLGKQMKVTGVGLEISLSEATAVIKNDPEMEVTNNENEMFLFSDEGTTTEKNIAELIFIRASGELVFEQKKSLATFYDNVRISRGKSTVFADKLTIPFDSELESLEQVIASGNVLASDGEKNAKGETLTWDSEKEIAILEDDPVAEFFDDKITITAPTIMFSKVHGKMDVPVAGQLTTIVNLKSNKEDKEDTNERTKIIFESSNKKTTYDTITINWNGRMSFKQDANLAIFEEDVIVTKEGTKLYCERLEIQFDSENDSLEELEATKDVYLIEKKDSSVREARGDKLIWAATRDYTELYGNNPLASVLDEDKQISAPKITFSETENKMFAEGKGNLIAKTNSEEDDEESEYTEAENKTLAEGKSDLTAKTSSEKKDKDAENLIINWNKEMIYNGRDQVANFYETIIVTKGKDTLDCDRLDVFFNDQDKIEKATAFGNVYFNSPESDNTEGLGTLLEWDLMKDMAVLTGNPLAELRRSGQRTFSKKIYFDITTKRVHWEGKPHWKIYQ
ncbi:MAG: LPS export ABC transporter periplasmic protein LptC [Candidatus Scalindua sp.]|nr:LPS export ABC transporter periplasmic protein LptC [Candidatus Scalindua sp.]